MAPAAGSLLQSEALEAIACFLADCHFSHASDAVRSAEVLSPAGFVDDASMVALTQRLTTRLDTAVSSARMEKAAPSIGEEELLNALLKQFASSGVKEHLNRELGKQLDHALLNVGDVPLEDFKASAQLPEASSPERAGEPPPAAQGVEAAQAPVVTGHPSEYYDQARPSASLEDGTNDEYRDDGDPGYRILMVSEAELLAELTERYADVLAPPAPSVPTTGLAAAAAAAFAGDSLAAPAYPPSPVSDPLSPDSSLAERVRAERDAAEESWEEGQGGRPEEGLGSSRADAEAASERTEQPHPAEGSELDASQLSPPCSPGGPADVSANLASPSGDAASFGNSGGETQRDDNGLASSAAQAARAQEQVQAAPPAPQVVLPHPLASRKKARGRRPLYCYAPSGDPFYPAECGGVVYDSFPLRVVYERDRTGFEESKEFPIQINSVIAARYQVLSYLGSAAFSRAVQCLDLQTDNMVCMKIIKNDKDFVDQSLDEIKLLKLINSNCGDIDAKHCLRLIDYFYHKEHLIIVTELLRDNLYEFSRFNREHGEEPYFTLGRLQRIARQLLLALEYIHGLWLIHADLKPENILVKSYSRCQVKLIDFGSSCFTDDTLSPYVQSRSYRAPEVILGLPYDQRIDLWSLGCVLAELWTGFVLFQNDSAQSLLARVVGIVGPFPQHMMTSAKFVAQFFTQDGRLYREAEAAPPSPHGQPSTVRRIQLLLPKRSSLHQRMRTEDLHFLDFLSCLLRVDPAERPSAKEALEHPWLAPGRYTDGL